MFDILIKMFGLSCDARVVGYREMILETEKPFLFAPKNKWITEVIVRHPCHRDHMGNEHPERHKLIWTRGCLQLIAGTFEQRVEKELVSTSIPVKNGGLRGGMVLIGDTVRSPNFWAEWPSRRPEPTPGIADIPPNLTEEQTRNHVRKTFIEYWTSPECLKEGE